MLKTTTLLLLCAATQAWAVAGDSPCNAVPFSTCTSIGSLTYTIPSSSWTTASGGIVNPTGSCLATGSLDANHWLSYTATSDDQSIMINVLKPGGGGSISACAFQVYSAASCSSPFSLVACQNNSNDDNANTAAIFVTAGTTYYIRVFDASGNGAGNTFKASIMVSKNSATGTSACNARTINSLPYSFTGNTLCNGNTIAGDCAGKSAGVIGSGEDYYFAYTSSGNEYISVGVSGLNPAIPQAFTISKAVQNCSDAKYCYQEINSNGSFQGGFTQIAGTDSTLSRVIYLDSAGIYYLIADAAGSRGGPFTLSVGSYSPVGSPDVCQSPVAISSSPIPVTISNRDASPDKAPAEPTHPLTLSGTTQENSRWYTFVANTPAPPDITVTMSNVATSDADYGYTPGLEAGIFSGTCGGNWSVVSTLSTINSGTHVFTIPTPAAGEQFYLMVDGKAGSTSTFTVSATNVVALPVSLTKFEAALNNNQVVLEWETGTETNNAYFFIEHSADNGSFRRIEEIPGAGHSNTRQKYQAIHPSPDPGNNYYRLFQQDYDGTLVNLGTRTVRFYPENDDIFKGSPNPLDNTLTLRFNIADKEKAISIFTHSGMRVREEGVSENQKELIMDVADFAPGVYFVRCTSGDRVSTQKFIKL